MPQKFDLEFIAPTPQHQSAAIDTAIIAGWTGRNQDAVEKHIRELEALGVKPPSTTPIFYRVSASRITTNPTIQATGDTSSGEVEFVLLQSGGRLWLGAGSDHTDRDVEAYDVTVSKQMCDKPIASQFWAFEDVRNHWDKLLLRSYIEEDGSQTLYQEGSVTAMREPDELIALYTDNTSLADNALMFCGTLAAIGGVRPSSHFSFELEDPVLGRKISHSYRIESIPRVS